MIITKQNKVKLLDREIEINQDGSINLENNRRTIVRLRFSVPSIDTSINIVQLIPYSGGYTIKTKNGTKKNIDNNIVKNILNFVDSDSSQTKIDTGTFTPSLGVMKIE